MLPPDDVSYILNDCTPEVIFYSKETEERVNEALADTSHLIRKICVDDIDLDTIDCENRILPTYNKEDVFLIIYTSGTTGQPKGVMHNFHAIGFAVDRFLNHIPQIKKEVFFSYLPLCHVAEKMLVNMRFDTKSTCPPHK